MRKIIDFIAVGLTLSASVAGQATWSEPPAPPAAIDAARRVSPPLPDKGPGKIMPGRPDTAEDNSEKRILVDPNVNLSLCVTEGDVKVNGWDRSEVRVFVDGGSKFAFKVLQKSAKTNDPVWVMVNGVETRNKWAAPTECIWGGQIEIDVPKSAVINIKGQETTTTIDRVKRVNMRTIGGDMTIRNVSDGITASAGQGDITVEESEGAMNLESTTGNILVFEAGPSEIGDVFKAKTNSGSISLQKLQHRQIEVNSISGSVAFNGEILSGGSYLMSTSKGSIKLSLPSTTACKVAATYGYGTFDSELPIKIETENITEGPIKIVVGKIGGGGDATLKLSSTNGSIGIRKKD